MEDPAGRRVDYGDVPFDEDDLAPTPGAQFAAWYSAAVDAGEPEPNAMTFATAGADGPSARTVLLKGADARGLVLYTGLGSRKGRAVAHDPRVALLFCWHTRHRQVAVRGVAEEVPRAETAAYFGSRPHSSRLGAWASEQSRPVTSSAVLREREEELRHRWPDTGSPSDVPVPPHWGGLLVRAREVEFWQGRTSRLHDRLVFVSVDGAVRDLDDADGWRVERRQP